MGIDRTGPELLREEGGLPPGTNRHSRRKGRPMMLTDEKQSCCYQPAWWLLQVSRNLASLKQRREHKTCKHLRPKL